MIQSLPIDGDLLCPQISIVLAVKDVGYHSRVMRILVAVEELFDFLHTLEIPLETWDDRQIAKKTAGLAIRIESRFITVLALLELGVVPGVRHARVGTAVVPFWLNARENSDAVNHHPMGADFEFVTKCMAHLRKSDARHI
jgi:hypothetical protein